MGSGECMDAISGRSVKADLMSPASGGVYQAWQTPNREQKPGKDLIWRTENLVLSPVVIAMWKPMAEAHRLGQEARRLGRYSCAGQESSKAGPAIGHPQWGQFKFGHTHPEFSNSGLISLLAEVYAGAGKVRGLTLDDLQEPQVGSSLGSIEQSVVHYGSSTGFFGDKLFRRMARISLSAAVLYENMVIESIRAESSHCLSLRSIRRKARSGAIIRSASCSATGLRRSIVKRQRFISIICWIGRNSKRRMTYGFRPAAVDVPLASPIDVAHGVDPKEPKTTLEVPSVEVMDGIPRLWHLEKKQADVILALDTSGSMEGAAKNCERARRRAATHLAHVGRRRFCASAL